MKVHGKILGLAPYDLRASSVEHTRTRPWNTRDGRFLVSVVFETGRTLDLGSAPHHPLQALLVTALVAWRWRARWRG